MSAESKRQHSVVLLADDNETDIELTQLSIAQSGLPVVVLTTSDSALDINAAYAPAVQRLSGQAHSASRRSQRRSHP